MPRGPLEPRLGENATTADFVKVVQQQNGSYRFMFDIDEQDAQPVLMMMGGLPTSGESRPVIIWRPTVEEIRQARREAKAVHKQISSQQKQLGKTEGVEE